MSTTETNTQSVKMAMEELCKLEAEKPLCAKGFALVHTLLVDRDAFHRQAELLDTPALAALELFPCFPLVAVPSWGCHSCGWGSCGCHSCGWGACGCHSWGSCGNGGAWPGC